ncbi:MAG: carbohydrate-binding domain-containing protein, partial [Desulfobacteraceae bacterium]
MKIKAFLGILMVMVLIVCAGGCGSSGSDATDSLSGNASDSSASSDDILSASSSIDTSPYADSFAETAATYDPEDVLENITFDYVIDIDFTENTAGLASTTAQVITGDGVTPLTVGTGSVIVAVTAYGITISSDVDANIRYNLCGELDGTLSISSAGDYQLYLDGLTIVGSAGPALDLESSEKVFIVTASGTTNILMDSATRSMTMKAALYGKGPMVFSGEGTLMVTGSYKHGIFSKDYIRVQSGELDVAVSAKDAVRSVNGFIFDDGDLTINATGTVTDDESKGVKVEGSEGDDGAGKGYIVINGGYLDITSVGKAITAGWDIDDDAETVDTSDDPSPYVEINNGVITITTTGTPYEYQSDGETVSCSPEGIEGKSDLTINSGYLIVSTTDDGLNAGNSITINGGYLYCASSDNDAIDSNGNLTITGGVIVAIGASAPESSFDCDQNTFAITGGTLVGIGGGLSNPTTAACTQNVVILGSGTQNSTIGIKADGGTSAFAFTIPRSYATMLLSSPDIETGTR